MSKWNRNNKTDRKARVRRFKQHARFFKQWSGPFQRIFLSDSVASATVNNPEN